ncbi:hypothetical protein EI94DRAFT_1825553 [Lactarius quietus]|nr:hypothetical protein EI94DRAFT_1825553 [Lactarius quietus]
MDTESLLIDGYISQSFQSRRAQEYFLNLLKITSIPAIETWSYPDREGHFFVVGYAIRHVLDHPSDASRLLDRTVVNRGTVVPQTMWCPHAATDKRQYVEEAVLHMPIFFEGVDGKLGLSLEASAMGRCNGLRNAQQFAPLGNKSMTCIRIIWPGYKEFKRQVQTRDETIEHNPITLSRFAQHIGRSVDAFLKTRQPVLGTSDNRHEKWRIGPRGIQPSDIIVIGAIHVSAGSWMPILQLNRYIL